MAQLGEKLDPVEQIKIMGSRNFALHLKDHDNKKREDVPYGDQAGALDVSGVLKALKDVKFTGHIAIEYEAHADNPSPDMKKCVAVLKELTAKIG
jgi:sugar phosphate isomerase/epimerase